MKIAVVGIGRVGLPFAAVCSKYHDTIGLDLDSEIVDKVNSGGDFSEPHLAEYLRKYGLKASGNLKELRISDIVFLCVGSQAPGDGYSAKGLLLALDGVIAQLVSKDQTLVIMTTISPLSVESELLRYVKDNRLNNRILGICYNPTMIALGDAIKGFENPNYLLIGESNELAGRTLESFWKGIVPDNIPIFRSSILNVALAKYALNTALTLKITLLNQITELAEKLGGDVDILTEILKADPRIAGSKMFKGGLGYGGTCFPVDVDALRSECKKLGLPTILADAIQSLNDHQVERSVRVIEAHGQKKIAVLGATYRQNTSVVVASQPLMIAERLAKDGYEVMIYDPMGIEGARAQLGKKATYSTDIEKALSFGKVVFLGVEWPEFQKLGKDSFRKDQIVIDPWRILRSKNLGCTYVGYGLGKQ